MIDSSTAARVVDAQWSWFLAALQDAGADVWDRPTRLTGWTVEDLARTAGLGLSTCSAHLQRLHGAGAFQVIGVQAAQGPDGTLAD